MAPGATSMVAEAAERALEENPHTEIWDPFSGRPRPKPGGEQDAKLIGGLAARQSEEVDLEVGNNGGSNERDGDLMDQFESQIDDKLSRLENSVSNRAHAGDIRTAPKAVSVVRKSEPGDDFEREINAKIIQNQINQNRKGGKKKQRRTGAANNGPGSTSPTAGTAAQRFVDTRISQQRATPSAAQLPGAYALGGAGEDGTQANADIPPDAFAVESDPTPVSVGLDASNQGHLLQAFPVSEDVPQQAEAFDENQHRAAKAKEKTKERAKAKWILLYLIMLVLVIVIPMVLLRDNGRSEESPPKQVATTTETPTAAVATPEEYILSLLPKTTVDKILESTITPQAMAFQWVLQDPYIIARNPSDSSTLNYPDWRVVQRFSLATIYFATNGPAWTNNTGWLDYNLHECEWYTWQAPKTPEPACIGYSDGNETEVYTMLSLRENNLQGKDAIPPELYLLTDLQTLILTNNPLLQGTISSLVGQLTNLMSFQLLKLEGLTGTLPSQIGLISTLKNLQFTYSNVAGTLPTEIGMLTNIAALFIDQNHLSGTIPTQIGLLDQMDFAYLAFNSFTGHVPSEVGKFTLARQLVVDFNLLTGPLPTQIGLMTTMRAINTRGNTFSGTIPTEFGLLHEYFRDFTMDSNHYTGTIPTWLGLCTAMKKLGLQNNLLTGQIPTQLAKLPILERVLLWNNSLSGTVPPILAQNLTKLRAFHITDNPGLTGTIPDALCDVASNLTALGLETCPYTRFGYDCGLSINCSSNLCGCNCSCS